MTAITRDMARVAGGTVWLDRAARLWFCTACVGQLAFIYFILAFYGARTIGGDFAAWNDKPLIDGHIPGDGVGNMMFAVHVAMAAVVTLGGLLQLVPALRRRWPGVHRWNGRFFLVFAGAAALGGLWLTWGRGTYLSAVSAVAITLDGLLILGCGLAAWRLAVARRYDRHRAWALRTFMVVNGVWFLRVAMMAWVLMNQGPRGMTATLSGPADIGLVFGSYLIPLAGLELYLFAQRSCNGLVKPVAAGVIGGLTAVMALGIFGTIAFMWGPHL